VEINQGLVEYERKFPYKLAKIFKREIWFKKCRDKYFYIGSIIWPLVPLLCFVCDTNYAFKNECFGACL